MSEVLSSLKYEVVEVIKESKYDYLSKHREYLYFPEDLEDSSGVLKENVVCVIKVEESIIQYTNHLIEQNNDEI